MNKSAFTHFMELFRKKPPERQPPSPETLAQFLQLFTLADTAATERLAARLALVLRDPAAYQQQFADELQRRSITAARPVSAQAMRDIALIDALRSEDLAVECDWKERADSMAEALNDVLARQQRADRLQPETLDAGGDVGPEQLDAVDDGLKVLELALVQFSLDGDSYPMSVVAAGQAMEMSRLATALGFEMWAW